MTRHLQLLLAATTASILTFTAAGQEDNTPDSPRPSHARDRFDHPYSGRLHSAAKASDIIGMTVKSHQNEKLGRVDDLAVDLESGRIVQVIVSTDGLAGVGDRLTAVPPGALRHDVANQVLQLDATREKLRSAPEFKSAKWIECCDSNHVAAVYTYYGQEPAFKFVHKGDPTDAPARPRTGRKTDGTWHTNGLAGERGWMIPASRLADLQKASGLMGVTVKNLQDETLGQVDNLMVDVQSGRIVAVVIASGEYLGIGGELSAVPPTVLSFNAQRNTLRLDASREGLSAAPHFQAGQWPDFSQPTYSEGIYRAYHAAPFFTTNAVTGADNTARNRRDRDGSTLTPLDQGNSQADTDTTAQIRRGILAGKDMSVNAKNVKIITNNGQVTLRGPVKSEEEKRLIGEIANRVARSENVDNQLEVALKNITN